MALAMPLHLIKLCVGAASVEDLADWQRTHRQRKMIGGRKAVFHTTFQTPKRAADLLQGGSLYWVIKGLVLVRQRLLGLEEGSKDDGTPCCMILLDPELIPVRPVPRRAFQGWRYLDDADAPADLEAGARSEVAAMPAHLRKTLADLCLL